MGERDITKLLPPFINYLCDTFDLQVGILRNDINEKPIDGEYKQRITLSRKGYKDDEYGFTYLNGQILSYRVFATAFHSDLKPKVIALVDEEISRQVNRNNIANDT